MQEIAEREKAGRALVIRPEEDLGISRTEKDPAELERVYQAGRDVATKRLMEIKEFMWIQPGMTRFRIDRVESERITI
jgi:predicted patatin/cPLA2 family phospholipase